MGNTASGKSRLAYHLSRYLNLPVYHIDEIQFRENWVKTSPEILKFQLHTLVQKDKWIIDGIDYLNYMEERICAADTIIFLDFNVLRNYFWLLKRIVISMLKIKSPGVTDDCPILPKLLLILKGIYERHKYLRPVIIKMIYFHKSNKNILHIRSVKRLNEIYDNHALEHHSSLSSL